MPLVMPGLEEMYAETVRDKRITDDNIDAAKGLPIYITNFIGSKQKLTDWIWLNTPEGVKSVLDAFSGSVSRTADGVYVQAEGLAGGLQ